jgi:hypothetical protein
MNGVKDPGNAGSPCVQRQHSLMGTAKGEAIASPFVLDTER